MCYFIDNSKIKFSETSIDEEMQNSLSSNIIALEYPIIPIITDESDEMILAKWRFNPDLPEDSKTRTIGLNIRAEEAHEKRMFKDYTNQHCIIPVNGFYEWKHYSSKIKIKHYLSMEDNLTFYLAGLWRTNANGKISFGVLTTNSNELMSDIHNSKLRMPVCLTEIQANQFLQKDELKQFIYPNLNPKLFATILEPEKIPNTLFY